MKMVNVKLSLSIPAIFIWSSLFLLASAKSYLQTNEVVEQRRDDSDLDLPECTPNSVCGYLQANTQGINSQRRCSCPAGSSCPMLWDSSDGHSITQGSDQYKFCGPNPEVKVCEEGFTAYTSRLVFSRETDQILVKADHIQCICPEGYNHVLANQRFTDVDEYTEAMELAYVCAPLETCEIGDYCKAITETPAEFLVQRKCVCPEGLRCPTDTSTGVKTTPMGKGFIHWVRCQR